MTSAEFHEAAKKPTRRSAPCPDCTQDRNGLPTGYAAGADPQFPHRCATCRGTGIDPQAKSKTADEVARMAAAPYEHSLDSLKGEAQETAEWRGHTLGAWDDYDHGRSSNAECSCGVGVTVHTNPAPNQVDIAGSAVAINHKS